MKRRMVLLLALGACLTACQKSDDTVPDAAQVSISISLPMDGQTYKSGDTVFIKANVTYPSELHGYEVKIVDTASGFIVFDDAQHLHNDHFVIDDKWVDSVNKPTSLKLSLIVNLDHNGNDARKELFFTIVP